MTSDPTDPAAGTGGEPHERVGDSLRAAVERTLAATAAPAAETRQRAQELLDEVVRRGRSAREQASRRGEAAREEVVRRGEQAGERIADVISDLRPADSDALESIAGRIGALEQRFEAIERLLRSERAERAGGAGSQAESNPQPESEERGPGAHSSGG